MNEEFISVRDRIISSAIDLISEAGIGSLSFTNISVRFNIPEVVICKYYSNKEEILVDVVNTYFKFDDQIFKTFRSKKCSNIEKLCLLVDQYSTYYGNYYTLSTLMLQYEELLHITETRDIVKEKETARLEFLKEIFQDAIDKKEISDAFTSGELSHALLGVMMVYTLDRRLNYRKGNVKSQITGYMMRFLEFIKLGGK